MHEQSAFGSMFLSHLLQAVCYPYTLCFHPAAKLLSENVFQNQYIILCGRLIFHNGTHRMPACSMWWESIIDWLRSTPIDIRTIWSPSNNLFDAIFNEVHANLDCVALVQNMTESTLITDTLTDSFESFVILHIPKHFICGEQFRFWSPHRSSEGYLIPKPVLHH